MRDTSGMRLSTMSEVGTYSIQGVFAGKINSTENYWSGNGQLLCSGIAK
jgi:hypothetical protein